MDKDKILQHFGKAFFDKITAHIAKYTSLWHLSDLSQIDYYSTSCLFTCISAKHGQCILKISPYHEQTKTEHQMLIDFDNNCGSGSGSGLCKVYEADVANGVLLIERITPGTQLRDEPNLNTRLELFCSIFRGLHKPPADKSKYPTYMHWVSRITAYMQARTDHKALSKKMTKAEEICRNLWAKYTKEMLLHGDLHHDNILQSNKGYRVIDPKGVVGDPVFDIPRFILNENDLDKGNNFANIVSILAKKLDIPQHDIRQLFYIEMCMAICWNVESNSYEDGDLDEVIFAESMMN